MYFLKCLVICIHNDMKTFILIFLTFFATSCTSEVPETLSKTLISYEDWKKEARNDMRLLPKYGNVPKNDEYKKVDAELLESVKKICGSLDSASNAYFLRGCDFLNQDDLKTA